MKEPSRKLSRVQAQNHVCISLLSQVEISSVSLSSVGLTEERFARKLIHKAMMQVRNVMLLSRKCNTLLLQHQAFCCLPDKVTFMLI